MNDSSPVEPVTAAIPLRTLIKQKNDIRTTLRELQFDEPEKCAEMLAELRMSDDKNDAKK